MDCPSADWTGILLAGGQSKRMGRDKRHMSVSGLHDKSLLDHASQLLEQLCLERVVLVGDAQEANLPSGFRVVADRQSGSGPLAAISDSLRDIHTPFALVIPVDMPCLRAPQMHELMLRFVRKSNSPAALFVLDTDQRPTFPLLAKREFGASLAAEVAAGQVRLFQGLRAAGAAEVKPQWQHSDSSGPDPFLNLNRPTDVAILESGQTPKRP